VVVAHLHDIMLYKVQSTGQCAEFHAIELDIWTIRCVYLAYLDAMAWWEGIPSVALRDQSRMFPRVG
jgi:hypothetical protein